MVWLIQSAVRPPRGAPSAASVRDIAGAATAVQFPVSSACSFSTRALISSRTRRNAFHAFDAALGRFIRLRPVTQRTSQHTVSHHLKILVDAGLLHREKRGTWAYYSLVPGALERAAAAITSL